MTPEEKMKRSMEFIVEHQAHFQVQLESTRALVHELTEAQKRVGRERIAFQKWSTEMTARAVALLEMQSRRIDRCEVADHAAQKHHGELMRRHDELMLEIRASFARIFEKLDERIN